MSLRHSSLRGAPLAAIVAIHLAATMVGRASADVVETNDAESVTIRLRYTPGRAVRYNLKLGGQTAWTPHVRGVQWGQMATDFTFTLRAKTIRPGGACTFDLLVENGLPYAATAEQKILLTADRPVRRVLRSETRCTLELLGFQDSQKIQGTHVPRSPVFVVGRGPPLSGLHAPSQIGPQRLILRGYRSRR